MRFSKHWHALRSPNRPETAAIEPRTRVTNSHEAKRVKNKSRVETAVSRSSWICDKPSQERAENESPEGSRGLMRERIVEGMEVGEECSWNLIGERPKPNNNNSEVHPCVNGQAREPRKSVRRLQHLSCLHIGCASSLVGPM